MSKNQKSKNNALSKLYNILDYTSKKDTNLKNEKYLGSLSQRLKEISGEEVVYRKKFEEKSQNDGKETLKPKVIIHVREVKKEPEFPEVKIEEEKKDYRDGDVFEIKKVKIKEPEFMEVKPKTSKEVIIDLQDLREDKEKLPEWDSIETVKKEEEFEEIPELESVSEEEIKKTETFEEIKTIKERKKETEEIQKICPECGTKLDSSQDVCSDCGKVLKDEKIPSFIPIKKVEKEEVTTEWEPIQIEKPKEEEITPVEIKDEKITVFKNFNTIDDKTSSLLFDNGITTIAFLDKASIKELSKIKGIKKKTAKKIKKELEEKKIESKKETPVEIEIIEKEEIIEEQIPTDEEPKEEPKEWSITEETDSKAQVWESIEEQPVEKETSVIEEYSSDIQIEEPVIDEESKVEAFKDIKNIDKKTAILLFDNGYTTVDSILEAPINDLAKIKGIKKKTVKKIKKELETPKKVPVSTPIEVKEETVKKDNHESIKEELDNSKKELKIISKELTNKDKNIQKLQNELEEKIKDLETKKTEVYNKDEEIKLLQNQSEQSKQELETGLEELNKKKEEMEVLEKELEDKKIELESKINEIEIRDEEIINLQNQLKQKTKDLETENEQLNKKDEEFVKINNDLIKKIEELEKKNKIITDLQTELTVKQKNLERKETEIKINAFKDLKNIDKETAILLYDNGITTIEELKEIPLKNLIKIKGIKRKIAKEIKKELEQKPDKKSFEEHKTELEKKPSDYFIEKKVVTNELKMKEEKKPKEGLSDENNITKEEAEEIDQKISDEFSVVVVDNDIFKGIKSIDIHTSKLLKENGIKTIDDLQAASVKDLSKIKGIKKRIAKKIKKEVKKIPKREKDTETQESFEQVDEPETEEKEAEWEYYDEDLISESSLEEIKGFRYKDYTLYEKEIETKSGKKRIVRFFSKAEPDDAEPIELPMGYEVKKNKKTGLPYLRKKK